MAMRAAKRRGRGPSTARATSAANTMTAAAVAHEVKPAQDLAEDGTGDDPAIRSPGAAIDSKMAGAAIAPSASSPPNQTASASRPANRQRKHRLIIIDASRSYRIAIMSIPWLPWSGDAFARAAAKAKPVLLFALGDLVPVVSRHGSHDLRRAERGRLVVEARSCPFASTPTGGRTSASAITLGGLPTTAFLTGDGDVFAAPTYMPPDRMAACSSRPRARLLDAGGIGRRAGASPFADTPASSDADAHASVAS